MKVKIKRHYKYILIDDMFRKLIKKDDLKKYQILAFSKFADFCAVANKLSKNTVIFMDCMMEPDDGPLRERIKKAQKMGFQNIIPESFEPELDWDLPEDMNCISKAWVIKQIAWGD